MNIPKIKNLTSPRTGKPVANQYEILEDNRRIFQSYDSIIVVVEDDGNMGKVTLDDTYWNYSKTTSKYRNRFLRENTEETRAKIESGEYTLANLN